MTILINFHKKGCWILNKSLLSSDANKAYIKVLKSHNCSQKIELKMKSSTKGDN